MFFRFVRTLVPSVVLIALVAVVASALAHEPDRIPQDHLGSQEGGLPRDYLFYVDETGLNGGQDGNGGYVVDGLYDDSNTFKYLQSETGSPSNVVCGVASREVAQGSRWPKFEFSPKSIKDSDKLPHGKTYAAPCKVTGKVTMKKRIAELLAFRGNSFKAGVSPEPIFPMYGRQEPRDRYGYGPRGSHFHFVLTDPVRSKFERVKAIKGLTVSGFVTGPKSHGSPVVEVKTVRDAQWLGRMSGKSCVAAGGDLQLRARKRQPHCPRGFEFAN
jgi:hypothetical protein